MSIFARDRYRHAREQYKNHWLKAFDAKYRAAANEAGFPQDDEFSLMQFSAGDANLDLYYPHQFIQNEQSSPYKRDGVRSVFMLEHTPVLGSTATLTVYVGNNSVQVGYDKEGTLHFDYIGQPEFYVEGGNINLTTGEVWLRWNKEPPKHSIVISYEYNMECQFSDQ